MNDQNTTTSSRTPTALAPANEDPEATRKAYCLPNRLHYIASSLDIDDTSEPIRVGQLPVFIRKPDPAGGTIWIDPSVMMGSKAYEVVVKRPVKADDTTDLTEVVPTGEVVVEVIGVGSDNVSVLVKAEEWFVESEVFKMGTRRKMATKPMQERDKTCMEVAV